MNREKIVNYLEDQFQKHKVYECMPENEIGYEYIPRDSMYKIVDGLIPLIKSELNKDKHIQNSDARKRIIGVGIDAGLPAPGL
jgi:hypothetical protein